MYDSNDKPTIEESYQTAGNTSDLTVEADKRGAGDVLIAAGWSESRIGMALLRLHSEWDGCQKPPRPTREGIAALVGTHQAALPGEDPPEGKPKPLSPSQAVHYATTWHAQAVAAQLARLASLPSAREQVTIRALRWNMPDAQTKAAGTIRYWLDQTCRTCHGLKWQLIPGAPALSGRPCRHCGGSGIASTPHGQDGRKLANFIDDCVSRARVSMRARLRSH